MGSWNKTCGLSNLHITAGSPVYTFVIHKNTYEEDRCYSTAFWIPTLLPFMSVYDDYGGGENSSKELSFILEGLKKDLVEMELGENEYHDIPVKKDELNEDLFFRAVHENRLFINHIFSNGETPVEFVMFRKDIVDAILENSEIEYYVGNGKGTYGYGNNYTKYKFSDVLWSAKVFLDVLEKQAKEDVEGLHTKKIPSWIFGGYADLFEWNSPNHASRYVRLASDNKFSRIIQPVKIVADLLVEGKREEAEETFKMVLIGAFIHSYIESIRKLWVPGCHEGSQGMEDAGYRILCNAITSALDEEERKYKSENYEYGEPEQLDLFEEEPLDRFE